MNKEKIKSIIKKDNYQQSKKEIQRLFECFERSYSFDHSLVLVADMLSGTCKNKGLIAYDLLTNVYKACKELDEETGRDFKEIKEKLKQIIDAL